MKPVLILTFVGFCSALLLSIVNKYTKGPILEAKIHAKLVALKSIFPFDFDEVETIKDQQTTFYEVKTKENALKGIAVETSTEKGYSGKINIILSVSPECKIFNYKVLTHSETPGLGDKITKKAFKQQFQGKSLDGFIWKVKKDGGSVDELTAATISSRAITDSISRGLNYIAKKYEGRCKK